MEKKQYAVGDAVRWGFSIFYERASFFSGVIALFTGLGLIDIFVAAHMSMIAVSLKNGQPVAAKALATFALAIGLYLVTLILFLGLIKLVLNIYDGEKPQIKTFFSQGHLVFRVIFARLALVFMSMAIALCCVVPALYLLLRLFLLLPNHISTWAQSFDIYSMCLAGLGISFAILATYFTCRYSFLECLMVDKNLGVIEAFKESARLTEGVRWKIFRLFLVYGLIIMTTNLFFNLLGYMAGMTADSYAGYALIVPNSIVKCIILAGIVYVYRKQQEQADLYNA